VLQNYLVDIKYSVLGTQQMLEFFVKGQSKWSITKEKNHWALKCTHRINLWIANLYSCYGYIIYTFTWNQASVIKFF
jgi:hypothetical protein